MADELKCGKCSIGILETFQRGSLVSGTRCLSCGAETFTRECKTVGEVRAFLDKINESAACPITLEAQFNGQIENTDRVFSK